MTGSPPSFVESLEMFCSSLSARCWYSERVFPIRSARSGFPMAESTSLTTPASSTSSASSLYRTLLTTAPPKPIPLSTSLSWKKTASSIGSACGPQTITKVVSGFLNRVLTRRARSWKPSIIPLKAVKNSDRSVSRSKPTIRLRIERTTPAPRPATLAASPVGFRKSCRERPSMNWVSRSGASRKSRALRLGGVSRTSRSNRPSE